MTDIRIPLLPTVKCTNCHIYIDVRTLDNHICVPIKKMTLPSLSGQIMTTSQDSDLTDPHTRTSAINSSVRHILRKIKGSEHKSIDTVASPTLSMASSTLSNNTMITTPRSSKDDLQHYIVGPHMDSTPLQKSNSGIANSFTLSKSKGRKKPVAETAVLQQLVDNMNTKDDLCQSCSKFITLSDKAVKDPVTQCSYHHSCYCCSLCQVSLVTSGSFEHLGRLYCAQDYKQAMNTRSKEPPTIRCQVKMPKTCYHCHMTFNDSDTISYKTFKTRIYCNSDFRDLFLPKCQFCEKAIEKEAISAADGKLQGKWHIECFGCQMCHASFPDNKFYIFENQPYCKTHYHYLNNSLCKRCHQGIENICAHTTEGWRFHPECFTCEVCQEKLNDTYYVFKSRVYCETHIKCQFINNRNNNDNRNPLLERRKTQLYNSF